MDIKCILIFVVIISATVRLGECKLKRIRSTDRWRSQNFIFEKNNIFPVDYDDVTDDFRAIRPDNSILSPAQYLWIWLFNRQSLQPTQSPQMTAAATSITESSTISSSSTTENPVTSSDDSMLHSGRSRRPLKYKVGGYCENPPKSHE